MTLSHPLSLPMSPTLYLSLTPSLYPSHSGVCEVGGSLADGGAALVIADIPGLVEGAHMVSQ